MYPFINDDNGEWNVEQRWGEGELNCADWWGEGGTEWEKNSSWYISLVEVLQVLKPKNWKVDGLERRAAEFLIDEEGIMVE